MFDLQIINKEYGKNPSDIDVEFYVAIPDVDLADEAWLLDKRGNDNGLLWSKYVLHDCGLLLPDDIKAGVYLCRNLRVINQYQSNNPENPEIDYDLECDWQVVLEYFTKEQNDKYK